MDYDAFKQEIKDVIKEYLPDKYKDSDVTIRSVTKNNDQILDGLTVSSPDTNVAPTIYLNSFYEEYKAGRPMDEILNHIAEIRSANEMEQGFNMSNITDWEKVAPNVAPRVIDSENNKELLSQRPHTLMDGMAVTYCVMLGEQDNGFMSVPITYELMDRWGVDTDKLHDIALDNLPELMPPKLMTMNEVMADMMLPDLILNCDGDREQAEAMLESMMPPEGNMYVISNEAKMNGATVLLNDQFMEKVVEQIGEDFYIIPSSIHECLLISQSAGMSIAEMENMVQDVNATQVAPEDRLSDHVFAYDVETKEIYRADHETEHRLAKEAKNTEKAKPEKEVTIADRMKAGKEKMENQKPKPTNLAKHKEAVIS